MRQLVDSIRTIAWNNMILEELGGNEEKVKMYHKLETIIIDSGQFGDGSFDLMIEACRNAENFKDIDMEALKMKLNANKMNKEFIYILPELFLFLFFTQFF